MKLQLDAGLSIAEQRRLQHQQSQGGAGGAAEDGDEWGARRPQVRGASAGSDSAPPPAGPRRFRHAQRFNRSCSAISWPPLRPP